MIQIDCAALRHYRFMQDIGLLYTFQRSQFHLFILCCMNFISVNAWRLMADFNRGKFDNGLAVYVVA